VRAIRPDDKERLRIAFAGLSARSVYQRFFHSVNELTADDLRRLTEIDFRDHVGIVLTVGAGSDERLIAVGRYVRTLPAGDVAEVAFTVADDYQHRGAATLLLRELVAIARERGVCKFVALVLDDNRQMLEIFRRSKLPIRESFVDGARLLVLRLDGAALAKARRRSPFFDLRSAIRKPWRRFPEDSTPERRYTPFLERHPGMNRPFQRFVTIAVAAAVGGLSAYGLISTQALPEDRMATAALVAAAEMAFPSAARTDVTPSYPEKPAGIVSYRDAVARAAASVVTVHSAHALKGALPLAPKVVAQGFASGVIVDRDGYIVTNYHVIEEASQLAVARNNGTVNLAQVVGIDPASDLALLKIDADNPEPIVFANVNDVAVGDVALAVGNPFGIGQTVTQGIVSAIVRRGTEPVDNFVQTDAAINPGNSGGALIDTAGRLIGINTVILSKSGGSEGIGFAIPGDLVQTVVATLKTKGHVARSWLGISTAGGPRSDGALVAGVERDGPADRAGIAPVDFIVRVGDKPVHHAQDVNNIVIGNEPGTHVPMEIVRSGKHTSVDVQLARIPNGASK